MKIGLMNGLLKWGNINKIIILCLFIGFPVNSQNAVSPVKSKTTMVIDTKGDTIFQFKDTDTKIVLKEVLTKEATDTLVKAYVVKDKLQHSSVTLEFNVLNDKSGEGEHKTALSGSIDKAVEKKDGEINRLNSVVKTQEKEIKKQKFLKLTAYIGGVIIPIIVKLIIK